MSPSLRIARPDGLELLLQFMREYYEFDGHVFRSDEARAALLSLLKDRSLGRAWLIFSDDQAAGYIVLAGLEPGIPRARCIH